MSVRKSKRDAVESLEGTRRGRAAARNATTDDAEDTAAEGGELDLSGLNAVVGYALRRAQLAVFEDFIARFAALDLTPAQYSVLLVIGHNPGRKQAEIASALGIQRPNFVNMLDELERRGLAERTPSATDRRSHALVLTKAGKLLLTRARAVQNEQERELARRLGPGGRETLVALLQRLV
jgi:DNA-binding MarR family transcriptional regulator